jgi:hypothetical protein
VLFCFFWRFIGVALVGGEELPGHCYLCIMGLTEAPAVQEQTDPSNYMHKHTISMHTIVHNPYACGHDYLCCKYETQIEWLYILKGLSCSFPTTAFFNYESKLRW